MLNLSHKKLDVYRISLKLVEEVYKVTRTFPKEEQFVLITQKGCHFSLQQYSRRRCKKIQTGKQKIL
jgi:hypothetical protein